MSTISFPGHVINPGKLWVWSNLQTVTVIVTFSDLGFFKKIKVIFVKIQDLNEILLQINDGNKIFTHFGPQFLANSAKNGIIKSFRSVILVFRTEHPLIRVLEPGES